MAFLLLLIVAVGFFPYKYSEKRASVGLDGMLFLTKYNLFRHFAGAVAGAIVLVLGNGKIHFDFYTILTSFVFGAMLFLCGYFGTYAFQITTVAINNLFASASLIVPVIYGAVFLGQEITVGKIIGLLVFFFGVYLITSTKIEGDTKQKFGIITFLVLMGVLLTSGIANVSAMVFSEHVPDGNSLMYMVLSYLFASLFYAIALPFFKIKGGNAKMPKTGYIFGGSAAISGFILQLITTYLAGRVHAAILFPITCGIGIIASALVGAMFFKEKLTVKNTIGILIGITSIIMINFL